MENKQHHIDQFIHSKLHDIEANPVASAFDALMKHCEHTQHPIDHAIDQHLSSFETPVANDIPIERLTASANNIDLSLHRQLHNLDVAKEGTNSIDTYTNKQPSKVKSFVLFGLFLIAGMLVTLVVKKLNKDEKLPSLVIQQTIENIKGSSKQTSRKETALLPEINDIKVQNNNTRKHYIRGSNSWMFDEAYNYNKEEKQSEIFPQDDIKISNEVIEENFTRNLALKGITSNRFKIHANIDAGIINSKFNAKYLKLPLTFELQLGILDEVNSGSKITSKNAHKDANQLFNASYGNQNKGLSIAFKVGYAFGEKFRFSSGVRYSYTKSSNPIDYYYTDVPVTDSLGNIKGYWYRPRTDQVRYNQNIEHSSSILSIPSSIQYQFWSNTKMCLFTGLGLQIDLRRTTKGSFLDFKNENMLSVTNTSKNLQPNILFGAYYKLNTTLSISSVFNLGYQQHNMSITNLAYLRKEFVPSVQFGIIYNPVIRK